MSAMCGGGRYFFGREASGYSTGSFTPLRSVQDDRDFLMTQPHIVPSQFPDNSAVSLRDFPITVPRTSKP